MNKLFQVALVVVLMFSVGCVGIANVPAQNPAQERIELQYEAIDEAISEEIQENDAFVEKVIAEPIIEETSQEETTAQESHESRRGLTTLEVVGMGALVAITFVLAGLVIYDGNRGW